MKRTLLILAIVMTISLCTGTVQAGKDTDYWLTDEPVTISYFISNNYQPDFNKSNLYFVEREEMTNVHVDWIIVSGSDYTTRKTLMWASGDLPDVIASPSSDEIITYSQVGALAAVDMYKDIMPNFYAAMHNGKDDLIEKMLTLDDGHIYSLPAIGLAYYNSAPSEFINKAWLDKLGLEMPTTVEAFHDVLVAFRDGDPNGNGQADEIPFAYSFSSPANIFAWFGVSGNIMIKDGVVRYSPIDDDYKTMVKYFNKLWSENLIDKEAFTQDNATYTAKAKTIPSIYGVANAWRMGSIFATENSDEYAVLPAQISSETKLSGSWRTHMGDGREWTFNRATVSASSKNLELVLRWMDIFYDPYYGGQIADGYIGTHIFQREDGQFEEVPLSEVPSNYKSRDEWKFYTMANAFPYYKAPEHCTLLATSALWAQQLNHQTEVHKETLINDIMPPSYQLPSEKEVLSSYALDINSYVDEMFALWITGERDVEADWADYLKQLQAYGVNEYVQAYQAYYDRVMK